MIESFELAAEYSAIRDKPENYDVPHEDDFSDKDPNDLLEAAVEAVAENCDSIREEEVLDVYRYLLKNAATTPGVVMGKLLDSITSGLKAELEATVKDVKTGDQEAYMSHRVPLDLYAFLLAWFSIASEKVKGGEDETPAPAAKSRRGRGGKAAGGRTASRATGAKRTETWSWQSQAPDVLHLILRVLEQLQTQRIWTSSVDRAAFLTAITRPAYDISENNEQLMKVIAVKDLVFKVICVSVKQHGQSLTLQIHITQGVPYHEHMADNMAECLNMLATTYDHTQTGEEVLRDIAGMTFTAQETKTPRAWAKFLSTFAELYPRSVYRQLALLINQQDSDAYPVRQAMMEILGTLIRDRTASYDESEDKKKTENEINGMFDTIFDRILDSNSYVRTTIFKVLVKVCGVSKFVKQRLKMASLAVMALEDKSSTVRKAAITLLIKLLETHPFRFNGGPLKRDELMKDYDEIQQQLKSIGTLGDAIANPVDEEDDDAPKGKKKSKKKKNRSDEDMDVDGEAGEEEGGSEEEGGDTETEEQGDMSVDEDNEEGSSSRKQKLKPRKSQININAITEEQQTLAEYDEKQLAFLKIRKRYCKDAINFIHQVECAMDVVVKLLGSKSKAEVLEAIDFFKTTHYFEMNGAQDGIKKMIHLIWTKDNNTTTTEDGKEIKGVRQKLLECYKTLYFEEVENLDPRGQVKRIAKNLVERTYYATLAELTSLEEMIRIMMEEGSISNEVIIKLWQIYGANQKIPSDQRRGSIIILGMLGVAKPEEVLKPQVELMLKVGLGKMGKTDLTLARYTCVALQRLNGSVKKVKGSLENKSIRYPMSDPIFKKLLSVVMHNCRSVDWFGLTEQVINTVYALAEQPAEFCDHLIKQLAQRVWNNPRSSMPADGPTPSQNQDEPMDDAPPEDNAGDTTILSDQTAAQTAGGISAAAPKTQSNDVADAFELSQLMFVVGHVAIKQLVFFEQVEREWKRQKEQKQAAEKAETSGKEKGKKDKDVDELDQVAGNAEDEIGDRIVAIRENELLYGHDSLLAVFAPMIVLICGSPHKFKNRTLRAACHLSLCKLLCVSSSFTDKNHRLLFKILETSRDPNIRANSVIALGDVAVSFNTIIDENSAELYKGLLDSDPRVKKTTLMVLTHLILNGMIKVKGQLGEMAKCVEDEDVRIQDLAKLFFSELSTKENAIYNNLPDIISHLSSGANATEEEKFESTMKYIFTFIEKEKQAEAIVEKLCQRFRLTEEPRQWRDIAFCLSLLPFKSDRLQFYRDKLHEPKVFERFQQILDKARQNKSKDKPDAELDEFEKILEEHKIQGQEDQALQDRVAKKAKKRRGKKAAPIPEEDE
ncbi:ARM repeat-containing protein [Coprinellus micaceus]|uniref:Condensin complex subunit 1 n=1 Tax=Coprinellus micaceus TaxID=71717 RepID=A0A4Y7TJ62_COPMI|nr:ARM repeat-containing protein [Coprinellus micaceus]